MLEEKQLQRGRDELRGGNPSGGQRVLSDRLGLCNRMGAFSECVCVCVWYIDVCLASSQQSDVPAAAPFISNWCSGGS